jgi:translation initiation factor 3 subunit I
MRPIVISCHSRPISVVRFNKDGDLFFVASLDGFVSVFWTEPVERLGTYKSEGAVKSLSVSEDSKLLISGSAVNGIFVFEVETGIQLNILPTNQLKQIEFSAGSKKFFLIHNSGSKLTTVDIFETNVIKKTIDPEKAYKDAYVDGVDKVSLVSSDVPYSRGVWGYLNKTLVLGTTRGKIDVYDLSTRTIIQTCKPHNETITDLRFAPDFSLLISSSRDCYCKIYDTETLKEIRVYNAQRPLNSAVVSPLMLTDQKYHAIIGGGQEIRDVTTTKNDVTFI